MDKLPPLKTKPTLRIFQKARMTTVTMRPILEQKLENSYNKFHLKNNMFHRGATLDVLPSRFEERLTPRLKQA